MHTLTDQQFAQRNRAALRNFKMHTLFILAKNSGIKIPQHVTKQTLINLCVRNEMQRRRQYKGGG